MKAVIFSPETPWKKGGIGRVLKEHLRFLDTQVFSVDTDAKETGIFGNITVFKAYSKYYLFSPRFLFVPSFPKILAHSFTTFVPLIAAIKTRNFYLMPHYHSVGSTKFFRFIRPIYDWTIGLFIIKRTRKIFCVSDYERKELIKKYKIDPKKILTVYNGVDIKRFARAKPYFKKKKVILYVGRLEKYKNVQYIIPAMDYLPEYQLIIIGSGPYKRSLEKISKARQVIFLSNLNDQSVERWFKTCSIFVTLSDLEAFGLTVIEALAAGKPVLVNNSSSLKELAELFPQQITKINVHKEESASLAQQIINAEKKTFSKVNLSLFDWSVITQKIRKEIEKE